MTERGADTSPGKKTMEYVSMEYVSGDWPIYGIDLVSWEQSAGHTEYCHVIVLCDLPLGFIYCLYISNIKVILKKKLY